MNEKKHKITKLTYPNYIKIEIGSTTQKSNEKYNTHSRSFSFALFHFSWRISNTQYTLLFHIYYWFTQPISLYYIEKKRNKKDIFVIWRRQQFRLFFVNSTVSDARMELNIDSFQLSIVVHYSQKVYVRWRTKINKIKFSRFFGWLLKKYVQNNKFFEFFFSLW
jgi:hypothetical protein